jgi:DNA (cytosine-5)-methyltransferase 1
MEYTLLDLFCCAGGASEGYARAGFRVVGVDKDPQPRYPFEFHKCDALDFLMMHGREFDAIAASPPCQGYSTATPTHMRKNHPDLIGPTRHYLRQVGRPSIIENVGGARWEMIHPHMLCGTMFPGLKIQRHRFFEMVNWHPMIMTPKCKHDFNPVVVNGTTFRPGQTGRKEFSKKEVAEAMGFHEDRMIREEFDQAIPPAYTEFLGRHLIQYLSHGKSL